MTSIRKYRIWFVLGALALGAAPFLTPYLGVIYREFLESVPEHVTIVLFLALPLLMIGVVFWAKWELDFGETSPSQGELDCLLKRKRAGLLPRAKRIRGHVRRNPRPVPSDAIMASLNYVKILRRRL